MLERDKWYTPKQVAEALGVHAETVRRWLRAGRLPAKRTFVGNDYAVLGADVLDRLSEAESKPVQVQESACAGCGASLPAGDLRPVVEGPGEVRAFCARCLQEGRHLTPTSPEV
jgi:excisionase family DNA binding protein